MKPNVCLLTACNSAQQPLAALTAPSMRAFAETHGYTVRALHRDDWERARGWIKIEAIRAALEEDFDFVFWIDVDALVLRRDVDIRTAAVDGACLTVVAKGKGTLAVEAIGTTRGRTKVGRYKAGTRVNLERALALGERLGGHLVAGHVDGVGTVGRRSEEGDVALSAALNRPPN